MNTLRAVLVGCGNMSRGWLRTITTIEGLVIVGLVDLVEDAARARKDEFGLARASSAMTSRRCYQRSNRTSCST